VKAALRAKDSGRKDEVRGGKGRKRQSGGSNCQFSPSFQISKGSFSRKIRGGINTVYNARSENGGDGRHYTKGRKSTTLSEKKRGTEGSAPRATGGS